MKRSFPLIAIVLIAFGVLFDWQLSHAVDTDNPASAVDAIENAKITMLLERIESLENRVATLERAEPLVRQADSRDSELEFQQDSTPPNVLPRDNGQRINDDAPGEQINGVKWKFRLLGHTRPLPPDNR